MKVYRPIVIALTISLFLAACAAVQQQKAQAARADTGEFHTTAARTASSQTGLVRPA